MLRTKSFLAPAEPLDGTRISIVGKHSWDPGIMTYTDLTEIVPDMYDEWSKILAPPLELVGDLYIRNKISQEEFRKEYLKHIAQPEIANQVRHLAHRSIDSTITLLCLELDPEYCHRRYLAEQCKEYEPSLALRIE